jgi:hypothetical protein
MLQVHLKPLQLFSHTFTLTLHAKTEVVGCGEKAFENIVERNTGYLASAQEMLQSVVTV